MDYTSSGESVIEEGAFACVCMCVFNSVPLVGSTPLKFTAVGDPLWDSAVTHGSNDIAAN